jgi:hypothetical protein
MAMSVKSSWMAASLSPIVPSPCGQWTDRDINVRPVRSVGTTLSSIAWKTAGTPAMTWTLPIMKPGATEIGLSM